MAANNHLFCSGIHYARIDPLEFEKIRKALADLAGIIDRAYDYVDIITRL